MTPINTFKLVLKSLLRSAVDCYVLPGTVTGTEILWLYLVQWKKEISAVSFAVLSIVISQVDLFTNSRPVDYHTTSETQGIN